MRKYVIVLVLTLILTGCDYCLDHPGAYIAFNSQGIMPENFNPDMLQDTFNHNAPIFFGVYSHEPFDCNEARFQILKKNLKTNIYGYSLYIAKDVDITAGEQYTTGCFTIYESGYYIFRFFVKTSPDVPLVQKALWIN